MVSLGEKFLFEVEQLRQWVLSVTMEQRGMEWELGYPRWSDLHIVMNNLLAAIDFEKTTEQIVDGVLYVIAADNACQIAAGEVAKYPEKLLYLAQAARDSSYTDARWQLAIELGNLTIHKIEAEHLLMALTKDEDEYTRRRALGALAQGTSPMLLQAVESAWSSAHEYQRIMALSALQKANSPELEKYLELADADGREYVVAMAERIRRGEAN